MLFYVVGDVDDALIEHLRDAIDDVAESRDWTVGPPTFIEEDDENDNEVLVGGTFEMYTALPPWAEKLDPKVDQAHFNEVTSIVSAMKRFSDRTGATVVFEIDDHSVGEIAHGTLDRTLQVGLLGEWERVLNERDGAIS
ncbi:MAG: hypothetical protein ABI779_00185 [Acidobacteriota bacterium]